MDIPWDQAKITSHARRAALHGHNSQFSDSFSTVDVGDYDIENPIEQFNFQFTQADDIRHNDGTLEENDRHWFMPGVHPVRPNITITYSDEEYIQDINYTPRYH